MQRAYILVSLSCFMKSLSWEAGCHSTGQQISNLLWYSNIYYCIHKCPPLVPDRVEPNPRTHFVSLGTFLILSCYIYLDIRRSLLISGFSANRPFFYISCFIAIRNIIQKKEKSVDLLQVFKIALFAFMHILIVIEGLICT